MWWNEVWLTALSVMGVIGFLNIFIGLIFDEKTACIATMATGVTLTWLFLIGWTTYGYVLIGKEENNCGMKIETSGQQTLMIVLLVFGSVPYCYLSLAILIGGGIGIYQAVKPRP